MVTKAAILKINFWRLLRNHGGIWVETYIVATQVDQNYIKFCRQFQDGNNSHHVENEFFY